MNGVRVGNRIIGADAPVTIGWENIPRVEGGPVKQFIFTWFQPTALFALILFWYYAPNSIASVSTAIAVGIGFRVLLLALEWVNPRYESWADVEGVDDRSVLCRSGFHDPGSGSSAISAATR